MFLYREILRSPHITAGVIVNGTKLKYGFQWLRKQNTADAVVVDEKTNASVLEHLVFKYDSFAEYLGLCADMTLRYM